MSGQGIGGQPARAPYGEPPSRSHTRRIRFLLGVFVAAFAAIEGRLVWLQVNPDAELNGELAKHVGKRDLEIPRGDIRDRRGSLLAVDGKAPSLWADPRSIDDPDTTALHISAFMSADEEEVRRRLTGRTQKGNLKSFVWVQRRLGDEETLRVAGLRDRVGAGLAVKMEPVRFYPEGDLAAHVLGFSNYEGIGCEGIELAYDRYLRSIPGRQRSRVDNHRRILTSLTLEYVEPEGGDAVFLTIDKAIQHTLEQELDRAMEKVQAPRAMGVLIDPRTGAILAFACRPAFDPNRYSDFPPEDYRNRALTDVFEPGSSFKIVTASAALEHGLITPETIIDCEGGSFNPYGHRITDYHRFKKPEPFYECFTQSSNVAMIKVAAMLGPERLEQWILRFGFGQKTSNDFPGESRGMFRPRSSWSRLSMGSLPIGQEVAVTILQMARAYSVIANGGFLVEPYIVERVVSRAGETTYGHQMRPPERILSAKTAATMKELAHLVVLKGTGKAASIPEYRTAGKTGTAQVARSDGGGYDRGKYTAVFAGFAPVSDPWICGIIVIREPGIREHWGGYCCGPVFRDVVREALITLGCPEDPVVVPIDGTTPISEDADTLIAQTDASTETLADPLDGLELVDMHAAEEGEPTLPSLEGLTMAQALSKLASLGLNWDFQGSGRVVSQDPPEQTPLNEVTLCRLVFSNERPKAEDDTKPVGPDSRM